MFTGIVKDKGRVLSIEAAGDDRRLRLSTQVLDISGLSVGASIAINGVCLTAVEIDGQQFVADVSHETLRVTTFATLSEGASVNVEPSLRVGDSLDGHWVTGHIDGVGRIVHTDAVGRSKSYAVEVPKALHPYIAKKGSIAVDGVSLTVNAVDAGVFEVTVIPHTQQVTIIEDYDVGTAVNIEVDIVARYMERLTQTYR